MMSVACVKRHKKVVPFYLKTRALFPFRREKGFFRVWIMDYQQRSEESRWNK